MIRLFIVAIGGLCLFGVSPASAGEVINVVVNTVHVLHLQRDANVVMVATPAIANVSVESPRLIFIFGIEPGETNLYVLDSGGNVIIESALVVTPDDDRHVTVNRPDDESTLSCAPRCAAVGTPVGSSSLRCRRHHRAVAVRQRQPPMPAWRRSRTMAVARPP